MKDDRDPTALGTAYLEMRAGGVPIAIAARIPAPDYSRTESTVDETKRLYRQQMTEQAARGEAAARIVCAEHGWAYATSCSTSSDERRRDTQAHNGKPLWANPRT